MNTAGPITAGFFETARRIVTPAAARQVESEEKRQATGCALRDEPAATKRRTFNTKGRHACRPLVFAHMEASLTTASGAVLHRCTSRPRPYSVLRVIGTWSPRLFRTPQLGDDTITITRPGMPQQAVALAKCAPGRISATAQLERGLPH